MKKVLVAAMAVALAAAMCVPASAFENEFGGYWRTRAYTQQDFSGDKSEDKDLQQVDTRTRLYYTAKFSDDFKFVNKFEFNTVWGDDDGGDVGADGDNFKVKNSYIDYNLGNYNFKIGTQGAVLARGLIMDDDFSGAVITGTFGGVTVPFYWIKSVEGGKGKDKNDADKDVLVISPEYKSGNMAINPFLVYAFQSKVEPSAATYSFDETTGLPKLNDDATKGVKDYNAFNIGLNFDMSLDAANVWATLIYQLGSYDEKETKNSAVVGKDISAYLMAFGGNVDVEGIDIHGQFFYASGDDGKDSDDEAFADLIGGQSYYWSEIMGYGLIDNQVSNNSCADKISNIMALNIGASMSPMDKLTVGADIWYAMLAEDEVVNGSKEDYLGTELDLSASYKVMDNLTLDVVAAYLFAGDATGDEDPMQLAAQLSFSF
jgi:hypothetical protein